MTAALPDPSDPSAADGAPERSSSRPARKPRKPPRGRLPKSASAPPTPPPPALPPGLVIPPRPPLPPVVPAPEPAVAAADADVVEPEVVEAVEPDPVEPVEPVPVEPIEPDPVEPVEPDPVEPVVVERELVEPDPVESELLDPEPVDPEPEPIASVPTHIEPPSASEPGDIAEESDALFATLAVAPSSAPDDVVPALALTGLGKSFGGTAAVAGLTFSVAPGTFFGLVGPNGAGKTTTLSLISGLLRPDTGEIRVAGIDARRHERQAKRMLGVLPDRLRTFDRLSGRQLLTYAGLLRGLRGPLVEARVSALARALDLTDALGRVVSDYSAGMTKKLMLAAALIHAPRLLVLDEPFEAVDPASSAVILDILREYVAAGGTVVLSSHGMDLVERVCDRVAIIAGGQLVAEGTVSDIRGASTLEERFVELVGSAGEVEGLEWLHTFSD